MTGVGLIVVVSIAAIVFDLPNRWLPTSRSFVWGDVTAILAIIAGHIIVMIPVDFIGGYFLPTRFGRTETSRREFTGVWARGVIVQGSLFAFSFLAILAAGRAGGVVAAMLVIGVMAIVYVAMQRRLVCYATGGCCEITDDKVERAVRRATAWGLNDRPLIVVHATDPGFNGGVVGLPRFESIVVPMDFVDRLTTKQLAVVVARRMVAIETGSRTRGIVVAIGWILVGFGLSTLLPGGGVTSVAELVMTCLGFTVWTFLGLLTLPTVSRQASYAIDGEVLRRGAEAETLTETIYTLDTWQDDEPSRGTLVETVFHPVPSASNRTQERQSGSPYAWHAARMTLFLSWSCMGLLSRAVHCNAGRPELWAMLPAD